MNCSTGYVGTPFVNTNPEEKCLRLPAEAGEGEARKSAAATSLGRAVVCQINTPSIDFAAKMPAAFSDLNAIPSNKRRASQEDLHAKDPKRQKLSFNASDVDGFCREVKLILGEGPLKLAKIRERLGVDLHTIEDQDLKKAIKRMQNQKSIYCHEHSKLWSLSNGLSVEHKNESSVFAERKQVIFDKVIDVFKKHTQPLSKQTLRRLCGIVEKDKMDERFLTQIIDNLRYQERIIYVASGTARGWKYKGASNCLSLSDLFPDEGGAKAHTGADCSMEKEQVSGAVETNPQTCFSLAGVACAGDRSTSVQYEGFEDYIEGGAGKSLGDEVFDLSGADIFNFDAFDGDKAFWW